MTEAVVAADADSITDIQDYLQSFNKEIGGSSEQNTSTTIATSNSNMITDTIYTIEGQKLTGNIVIAESGEPTEQGGNYPTFMVMNDQQYMLIMSNESDQAATNDQSQALVVTTDGVEATTESNNQNLETPEPKKKGFRSKRQIKQEVFEEDNRNDISVYDFNELNMPNRNNSTAADSIDTNIKDQSGIDDDDDDPDFKAPVIKTRGRAAKDRESNSKKSKSNTGSGNHSGSAGNTSSGNVHVCTYCSYTSNKRYLLSRHLKSHSEDRPHKCGICERGFKVS